jgi:hypothetical protein
MSNCSAPDLPSADLSTILGKNLSRGPEPDVSFIVGSLTVDRVKAKPADRGSSFTQAHLHVCDRDVSSAMFATNTFESTLMCGGVHGSVHYAATYIDRTAPGLPLMIVSNSS